MIQFPNSTVRSAGVLALGLTLCSTVSAQVQTLWQENFDGAGAGELSSLGLGFSQSRTYGSAPIYVGEVAGFGAGGTSPNGAIRPGSTDISISEYYRPLGTLPADGRWVLKLTCDAIVTGATYNSGMFLSAATGASDLIGWWGGWPMGNPNNYGLDARMPVLGNLGGDATYTAQAGGYGGQVVTLTIEVNAYTRTIQGELRRSSDGNVEATGPIPVRNGVDLSAYNSLGIMQDHRDGWGGMAFDNVSVTLTAVPEPSSMAVVVGGLLAGFAWMRRRQQRA